MRHIIDMISNESGISEKRVLAIIFAGVGIAHSFITKDYGMVAEFVGSALLLLGVAAFTNT